MAGTTYGTDKQQDIAMRVIADHIRTIAFAITDGQLPSNAKAGYVIPSYLAACRSLRLYVLGSQGSVYV